MPTFSFSPCARSIKRARPTAFIATLLLSSSAFAGKYEQLIISARDGNTAPALHYLQQQKTLSLSQISDWLQIALWSGDDRKVIYIYTKHQYRDIPKEGVAATALALRNTQQWNRSLVLWNTLLRSYPGHTHYHQAYIMTLADAGQNNTAIELASTLVDNNPSADNYQVQAYVYQQAGQPENELLAIALMNMTTQPAKTALHEQAFTLQRNRIALQATHAPVPDQIRADAAAELVRLSFYPSRSEADRYRLADRALASCDALLKEWQRSPATTPYRQVLIDRLGALRSRDRTAEVVAEWERLQRENVAIPDYALYWVASALLAERQPNKASAIMQHLVQTPEAINALEPEDRALLYYGYIESELLSQALDLTRLTEQSHPWQRNVFGNPIALPNESWLQGQQFRVGVYQFGDDLPEAEQRARALSRSAPGNQGLRIDLASLLSLRGLPREAEWQLKKAETLEPTNISLLTEQAWVAQSLQEWRQFSQLTDSVTQRAPSDPQVRQLQRGYAVHQKTELRVEGSLGIDSDSPDAGTDDFTANTVVYSSPVAENWRGFAGYNFARGGFSEGKERLHSFLAGVEWRSRDLTVEVETSGQHLNGETRSGARVTAQYAFSDHWELYADAQRLSNRAPLRARHNDIIANSVALALSWYQNERRQYNLGAAVTDFSDGNLRQEYVLSGKEQLWSLPHLSLDLLPTLGFEKNNQDSAPYFNPKKAVEILPALRAEHLMYRHYDTTWSQEFIAGAGNYWQDDYGNGAIVLAGYGQRVLWNNVLEAGARLTWERRPWDGEKENNLSLSFDLNFRF